jgi:hypothetical protein
MKKKLIFGLLVVFFSIQKTYSQEWIFVDYTDDDTCYINSKYLSKGDMKIKIWVKEESKKQVYVRKGKSKVKKTVINIEKTLFEFDCENQKYMNHYSVTYNSSGSVIKHYEPLDYQKVWHLIIPGSVGESLLNKACEIYND